MKYPSHPWHQRGLNDIALEETPFFSLSLCTIHLSIKISRGISSILPYGQQLLFLPGCHLFSCYFFDFIFKQYNMEYSNTERGTDGKQIQIPDFQSHPNISDWLRWGIKPDCQIAQSKQISISHHRRGETGSKQGRGTPKPSFCHQESGKWVDEPKLPGAARAG